MKKRIDAVGPTSLEEVERLKRKLAEVEADRRRIEETLGRRERDYREIVQNQGEGIGLVDADERFTFANPAGEAIFGVEPGGLVGRTVDEFLDEDHRRVVAEQTALRKGGERSTYEVDVRRPDGAVRRVLVTGAPRFDGSGRFLGTFGVFRDITERVRAEREMRASEEKYRALFEVAGDAIFLLQLRDGRPRFVDCNPAALEMFGCQRGDILGRSPLDFSVPVQPDGRPSREGLAEHAAAVMAGEPQTLEWVHCRLDGTPFDVEVRITLVSLRGEAFMQAVVRDVSTRRRAEEERRQLEARAQQAQKLEALGRLAGGIAHDFNNLLTGVLSNAGIAQAELEEGSAAREAVEDIAVAARRAADLSRQMLAYSGRGKLVVEPLDLSAVVREMGQLLSASVPKSVTMSYRFAPGLPAIRADGAQLRQVVMNLITNAAEAMGDRGGVVTLTTGVRSVGSNEIRHAASAEPLAPGDYHYCQKLPWVRGCSHGAPDVPSRLRASGCSRWQSGQRGNHPTRARAIARRNVTNESAK